MITLGALVDLGWAVDLSVVEPYSLTGMSAYAEDQERCRVAIHSHEVCRPQLYDFAGPR